MQLHRLKLSNFRLHADTEVEFGPGITAIVGQNGSGKTTLLEGIAWALYGTHAARGGKDSVRRIGAGERAQTFAEVDFSLGAHEYVVKRGITKAELFQDGGANAVANSQRTVTEKIESLLGMSRDEFFNTYFAEQKELAIMASMGPADRGKFLSRLLGYERLRVAQKALRERRSTIRGQLQELEAVLEDAAALETERVAATAARDEHQRRFDAATAAHRAALERLAAVVPQWRRIVELRDSIVSMDGERRIAESRVRMTRQEFERIDLELAEALRARDRLDALTPAVDHIDTLREDFERLNREAEAAGKRRALMGQLDEVSKQLTQVSVRVEMLCDAPDSLKRIKRDLDVDQAAVEAAQAHLEELQATWIRDKQDAETKHVALRDQYRDASSQQATIAAAGEDGECPTCGRPLGRDFGTMIEKLSLQLEEIESNGKFYRQRVRQLTTEPAALVEARKVVVETNARVERDRIKLGQTDARLKQLREAQQEHERLETRVTQLENELASHTGSYDIERHEAIRKELTGLDAQIRLLAELRVRAERGATLVEEAERTEQALSVCEERAKQLGEFIAAAGFSEGEFERLRRAHEEADAATHKGEVTATSAQGDLRVSAAALSSVEERIRRRATQAKRRLVVHKDLALHDELDTAYEDLRASLNARLRPDLAEIASSLLSEITDGRYQELELDERYRLSLVEDGVPKAVISGGEEDIANLVLRLAISQLVSERAGQPLSLLVLDEIFGGLDDQRRQGVVALLRGLTNRYPQVILITHIESVRDGVDRVLRVVTDVKERTARVTEDNARADREAAA